MARTSWPRSLPLVSSELRNADRRRSPTPPGRPRACRRALRRRRRCGGTEVSGGSYARVGVTSGTSAWNNTQGNTTGASTGADGTIENAAPVNFPTPSAGWGTVTHFGVYDAASGGNLLFYAALSVAKTINTGDTVSFAAGALSLQIDN